MKHELKCWCEFFMAIADREKCFEIRKNDDDRDFKVEDRLLLREWDNIGERYTGRSLVVRVDYILPGGGSFGLEEGFCVMSITLEEMNMEFDEPYCNDANSDSPDILLATASA